MKHMQMGIKRTRHQAKKNPKEKKRQRLRYGRTCERMTPPYRLFRYSTTHHLMLKEKGNGKIPWITQDTTREKMRKKKTPYNATAEDSKKALRMSLENRQ